MFRNQSFDEKITSRRHNEDYELRSNSETGKKFIVRWDLQSTPRYFSKNRFASPRSLNRLVSRRSKSVIRYNINRSLNFDVGPRIGGENFSSANSSTDSNSSTDNDNYLSRSAKILRALNIDYSPLRSVSAMGIRKINKSLNFDLSPSPKNLVSMNKSGINVSLHSVASPLSKVNKTLNFETSSSESSVNSRFDASVESIDENQNQTPSQRRNRNAKKSLNYSSPQFDNRSPMLRTDLREKIDNIVQNSVTPNFPSSRRSLIMKKKDFGTSTPRNLLNDFDDYDVVNEQDNARPQTPENFIQIIPVSMSAIKKSHKKERELGRLGKAIAYQTEICPGGDAFTDIIAMDIEPEEKRPTTPVTENSQQNSPQCSFNSIKQSHKKDKSKRKSYREKSEDEMSEMGSIFDYTSEINELSEADDSLDFDKNSWNPDTPERRISQKFDENEELSLGCDQVPSDPEISVSDQDGARDVAMKEAVPREVEEVENPSLADEVVTTPQKSDSDRPVTPENQVNLLQRITTDSIKKSHKKIKGINKKHLFKPRTIEDNNENANKSPVNEENKEGDANRATTPENINSSRLLLSQFSSVKKSHRKDKHIRMVSGSLQRRKNFGREPAASLDGGDVHNCSSVSSPVSNFSGFSPVRIAADPVEPPKINEESGNKDSTELLSSDSSNDAANYHSLARCCFEGEIFEAGINALPTNSEVLKPSPNKRKNDGKPISIFATSPSTKSQDSATYESAAEEEFKIFTPIKKRKSLNLATPLARRICDDSSPDKEKLSEEPMETSTRCCTPTTTRGQSSNTIEENFKTPDRSDFVPIAECSTPKIQKTENPRQTSAGRSTPQNRSAASLIADVNSIKRSHKKDKRGNVSRRYIVHAQNEEYESELTTTTIDIDKCKSSLSLQDQPSTSNETTSEISEQTKTPPNCLQAKNYLRLLQTESIKRSHKKVRERKKYREHVADSELSDDGSIFDDNDRSVNESKETIMREPEIMKSTERVDSSMSPGINILETSYEENNYQEVPRYCGNLSDDGSIFDSEEKLENSFERCDHVEDNNKGSIIDESNELID